MSAAHSRGPLIKVTSDEELSARGLANRLDDMTMEISPYGGHLVCIAICDGCQVCWACCEPFGDGPEALLEKRPGGSTVPVGIHRKCFNPKDRRPFSDMGGRRELQSVSEVSKGLRLRRTVAKVVKPFLQAAQSAASKIVL